MSLDTTAQAAYLIAALLFILALAGLSRHETARVGNTFGMAGMATALVATIALAIDRDISGPGLALLLIAMVAGAALGLYRAQVVKMTGFRSRWRGFSLTTASPSARPSMAPVRPPPRLEDEGRLMPA